MGRGYANVGWLGLDANQWRAEPKSMTQLTCFNGLWVKPGVSASQEIIFACGKNKNEALLSNPTTPNSSCFSSLFHLWPTSSLTKSYSQRNPSGKEIVSQGYSTNLQAHLHRNRDSQEEVVDRASVWQVNKRQLLIYVPILQCQSIWTPTPEEWALCLLALASVAPHSLIFMCVGVADVGQ